MCSAIQIDYGVVGPMIILLLLMLPRISSLVRRRGRPHSLMYTFSKQAELTAAAQKQLFFKILLFG